MKNDSANLEISPVIEQSEIVKKLPPSVAAIGQRKRLEVVFNDSMNMYYAGEKARGVFSWRPTINDEVKKYSNYSEASEDIDYLLTILPQYVFHIQTCFAAKT